jgi:hypothetical protein
MVEAERQYNRVALSERDFGQAGAFLTALLSTSGWPVAATTTGTRGMTWSRVLPPSSSPTRQDEMRPTPVGLRCTEPNDLMLPTAIKGRQTMASARR